MKKLALKTAMKTAILATALFLPTLSYAVGPPKVPGEQDPSLYFPSYISTIPGIPTKVTRSDHQFFPVFETTTPAGQLKNYEPAVISNQSNKVVSPPVGRQAGIEPSEEIGAGNPRIANEAL